MSVVIQGFNGIDLFQWYMVRNPRNKYISEWTANNLGSFKIDWKNRVSLDDRTSTVIQYFQVILVLLRQKYKRPSSDVVVNPGKFVKFVREWQGGDYNVNREEDAGELFVSLLSCVHQVINRANEKERAISRNQIEKQLSVIPEKSFSSDKHLSTTKDKQASVLELSNLYETPTRQIESHINYLLRQDHKAKTPSKQQQAGNVEGIDRSSIDTLPKSPKGNPLSDRSIPLRRAKTDLSAISQARLNKSENTEIPLRSQSTITLPQKHFDLQTLEMTARHSLDDYLLGNRSVVVDLFLGQLLLALKCRVCNAMTVRFDPFFTLTLPLPTSALLSQHKSFNLKQCFKQFSRTTRLEGQYCQNCNQLSSSLVQKQIWSEPNVLVLRLNRFKGGQSGFKYQNSIYYPVRNLKLDTYLLLPHSQGAFYDLASVICHKGANLQSGSFYTISRIRDSWYKYEDSKVTPLDGEDESMVADAYILIYEKIVQYVGRKEAGQCNTNLTTTLPNQNQDEPSQVDGPSTMKVSIIKPPTGKPHSVRDLNKGGITESMGSQTRIIRFTTSNGFGKQSFLTEITTPQSQQVSQLQRRSTLEKNIQLGDNSRDSLQEM